MASTGPERKRNALEMSEGAMLAEAIAAEVEALQRSGHQVKDVWKAAGTGKSTYYKYKHLTLRPPVSFLWRLYCEARYAEQPSDGATPADHGFSHLVLLLFSWFCADPRAALVKELRKEKGRLEQGKSLARRWSGSDQIAELEQAIEALAPVGSSGSGGLAADAEAGGEHQDRIEAVSGGSAEDMVAPVPLGEGDRRNPTGEERADIDAVAQYWRAGRLADALVVTRAIAADHSAESLVAFVDVCKDEEAGSLLESFLSGVAGNAEADAGRALKAVRLFLDAGYRHEALAIEAEAAAGAR